MNTLNFLYNELSEEEATKLRKDIENIINESTKGFEERLKQAVKDASDEVMNSLIVNPWSDWVTENSGAYDFVNALMNRMWEMLKKGSPSDVSKYTIKELVNSWLEHHPEEAKKVLDNVLLEEIESLKKRLEFEMKIKKQY